MLIVQYGENNSMNILFIFPIFPEDINTSSLVKDLTSEFEKQHNVYIATPREKKFGLITELQVYNNVQILRVRTGNLFDTVNKFNKLITIFTMPRSILLSIKNYWYDVKFDLIVTQTPYTSNALLINELKLHYQCPALLILFDIFPQNAKDIELIKNSILFNFFKYKERKMLLSFDYIGCMSKGNIEYLKNNYSYITPSSLFLLPLWGIDNGGGLNIPKEKIRKKYGLKINDFVLIFGGNMGKPQKIDNIIELAKSCSNDKDIKFLFVGKGTEAKRIKKTIKSQNIRNAIFIDFVPREDYEDITRSSDIGLISLDERFTVPNFPSKSIDYMRLGLPILASLDDCSAKDYGKLIQDELKCGLISSARDTENFKQNLYKIKNDEKLRKMFKKNGLKAFTDYFSVRNAYMSIVKKIR
jgi:glycosyltransferase involved in cell wall biosynthesis